jgi:hypothetical protein
VVLSFDEKGESLRGGGYRGFGGSPHRHRAVVPDGHNRIQGTANLFAALDVLSGRVIGNSGWVRSSAWTCVSIAPNQE